jgi:hypothetical protein
LQTNTHIYPQRVGVSANNINESSAEKFVLYVFSPAESAVRIHGGHQFIGWVFSVYGE